VAGGGRLFVSAGGGLLDEKNATNAPMAALLGVTPLGTYVGRGTDPDSIGASASPRPVQFIKQDLPFAPLLDTVEVMAGGPGAGSLLRTHGAKSIFRLAPPAAGTPPPRVLARFLSDGSPALLHRAVGAGAATYAAFLPGLAYFAPAIPQRPVDRAATDAGFNHFVPTQFADGARDLLAAPLAGVAGAVPVETSEPLVEAGVVTAAKLGTAIPLVNWADKPLRGLSVTLNFTVAFTSAALANGGELAVETLPDGRTRFTVDALDLGDAIVLRH